VIGVELPITLELEVADTEPGVRGDTVSGSTKPAKLQTGATVNVPLFVNPGDIILADDDGVLVLAPARVAAIIEEFMPRVLRVYCGGACTRKR